MESSKTTTRVCICGGGSQSQMAAGVIGSMDGYVVDVLTRRPDDWSRNFVTEDCRGREFHARLGTISSDPRDVVPGADIVYICLPGYAIGEVLEKIKPHLRPGAIVGSSFGGSGFFLRLFQILGSDVPAFCFQRVPAIARIIRYGHSAALQGYKPALKIATVNIADPERIAAMAEEWFQTPTSLLSHWLEVTLSNSNPLLHPVSLSVLFADWEPEKVYSRIPEMYTDWTDEASRRWIAADAELQQIISRLPMRGAEVPTVEDYYEVHGPAQLTAKMRSIEAFRDKPAPMTAVDGGYRLDSTHRMFTEDVCCGLITIKSFAEITGVDTPMIDSIIEWTQKVMGKSFLIGGRLAGEDLGETLRISADQPL